MSSDILLKRKFYDELLNWKRLDNGRTALLVEGARRVGKTTLVEAFAANEYEDYLIIDFSIKRYRDDSVFDLIGNRKEDMDAFFRLFFLLAGRNSSLPKRKSLIVFDEVQLYPKARQAIKFLVKDGRYDYIETGSLVSIKSNSSNILIPSEEIRLSMYPLTFDEFLTNTGNSLLLDTIKEAYASKKPLPDMVHRIANERLREYLLVGGMPQAVVSFIKGEDYSSIGRIQKTILALYREDINKSSGKEKIRLLYDDIPTQLTHHGAHFIISRTNRNYRASNTYKAFAYIDEAMIGNRCYDVSNPEYVLSLSKKSDKFRLYQSDVGLFVAQCYESKTFSENEIHQKFLLGKLSANEGSVIETYVSQTLKGIGYPLYCHTFKTKNGNSLYEIDFLIGKDHKVSPIEVKSSDNLSHTSLDVFKEKYGKKVGIKYVLSFKNMKWGDNLLYLPLYMTFLL